MKRFCPLLLVVIMLSSCSQKEGGKISDQTDAPLIEFEVDCIATGASDFSILNELYDLTDDNKYTNILNARNKNHLSELLLSVNTDLPDGMEYDTSTFLFAYGRKLTSISSMEMNSEDYILTVVFEEEYHKNQVFIYAIPKIRVYPFRWSIYYLEDKTPVYLGRTVVEINKRK